MAHKEQQEFFKRLNSSLTSHLSQAESILEIGSQNINGTVRTMFPHAKNYIGIDLGVAASVDWVIPGQLIELPNEWADITLSTECFEHCRQWSKVLLNMIRITRRRGLVIVTCAGAGRPTHGTIDSDEVNSPFTTSYYKNLSVDDISNKIALGAYFDIHGFEVNSLSKDTYFWGIRSERSILEVDSSWEDPLSRLSRAQGQLAQAAARHSSLQAELNNAITVAKQAKDEAQSQLAEAVARNSSLQAELNNAVTIARQAKDDAEQSNTMAQEISANIQKIYSSRSWRILAPWRLTIKIAKSWWR